MWSKAAALLVLGITAAGCFRPVPDLPPDYGSVNSRLKLSEKDFSESDLAMTCPEIEEEVASLSRLNRLAEAEIESDRTQNQVAGYFAALFVLPIAAVDTNEKQVDLLNANQERLDALVKLKRFKSCDSDR